MWSRSHAFLASVLSASGFEQHKTSWYWAGEEVLAVLRLERAPTRNHDVVLVGLREMRTGDVPFPRLADCDVIRPLEELVSFDPQMFDALMDRRSKLSPVDRILGFEALIQEALFPLLLSVSTVEGMLERVDPMDRIATNAVRGVGERAAAAHAEIVS